MGGSCFQIEDHDIGEYTIAIASDVEKLIKTVNSHIDKRWLPIGGISAVDTTKGPALIQALVRSRFSKGRRVSRASM